MAILKSYEKYIFTKEFKEKVDYKVFITSDNLHIDETIEYFSLNNIGNIHLTEHNNFYLYPISNPLTVSANQYLDTYMSHTKRWEHFMIHDNCIHQHYKILDCYNMARTTLDLSEYDYVVRLRLDIKFKKYNILDLIDTLESNKKLHLIMCWDVFAIVRPDIMKCYCTGLEHNYGNYNYSTIVPVTHPVMPEYHTFTDYYKHRWTYAPERQLFEMMFEYCVNRNLPILDTIHEVNSNCEIIRHT
jgi:hypothetical protein